MKIEKTETPLLDAALETLPPPSFKQTMECQLEVARSVMALLRQSIARGTLTKRSIELALSMLPKVGGIEAEMRRIVDWIQMHVARRIEQLPA